MGPESPETVNPKQKKWQETLEALDHVVDKLGRHVDPGIKETVAALNCLAFETDGSCEGHEETKSKAPWVDLPLIPKEFRDRMKVEGVAAKEQGADLGGLLQEGKAKMIEEAERLMKLLDEFYSQRRTPSEKRLILRFFPDSARLHNQGGAIQELRAPALQRRKLREFQDEMAAFAQFMKEKFFWQD